MLCNCGQTPKSSNPHSHTLTHTHTHSHTQTPSGERGIRTPGSAYAEQRLSRPPRSTAPAPLRLIGITKLTIQARLPKSPNRIQA